MNSIKMNRQELLEIVRQIKLTHIAQFEEAVADYKSLILQISKTNVSLAKTGDLAEFKKMKHIPAEPRSYEDSYRRAIRMLELSIEDVIDVEEDVFNQLVLDEWTWKNTFTASNSMYKAQY